MAKATLAEETAQAVIRYIIDNRLLPGGTAIPYAAIGESHWR